MRPFKTVQEAYDYCVSAGHIIPQEEIDLERIKCSLQIAKEDLQSAVDSSAKKRWNSAYKMYYDVIHQLGETFLRFDKIKATTHLSLFVYLVVKYPQLELNWDFFERIRTKRNGINYYGTPVSEKDWKEVALEFQLNINLLKKKIQEKLMQEQHI